MLASRQATGFVRLIVVTGPIGFPPARKAGCSRAGLWPKPFAERVAGWCRSSSALWLWSRQVLSGLFRDMGFGAGEASGSRRALGRAGVALLANPATAEMKEGFCRLPHDDVTVAMSSVVRPHPSLDVDHDGGQAPAQQQRKRPGADCHGGTYPLNRSLLAEPAVRMTATVMALAHLGSVAATLTDPRSWTAGSLWQ